MNIDWTKICDILKNIATIFGCAVTIITFLTATIKPLRNKFHSWIRKINGVDQQKQEVKAISEKLDSLIELMSQRSEEDINFRATMTESIEILKKGSALSLGDVIRRVYNTYKDEKKIPEKEFEIVKKAYEVYHDDLKSNGPVEYMYTRMEEWEVIID